jgi:hypothetical protein
MSEENYDVSVLGVPTHPDLKNIINCALSPLKPEKSKRQYEKRYSDFRRSKSFKIVKICLTFRFDKL